MRVSETVDTAVGNMQNYVGRCVPGMCASWYASKFVGAVRHILLQDMHAAQHALTSRACCYVQFMLLHHLHATHARASALIPPRHLMLSNQVPSHDHTASAQCLLPAMLYILALKYQHAVMALQLIYRIPE